MAEPADRRLVVMDVDGTLLTSAGTILPSTRRAVGELIARGHHVALASARPPRSVAALSRDLLGNDLAPTVSLNGALVCRGQRILMERCIPTTAAAKIVRAAHEIQMTISSFSGWHWRAEQMTSELREEASILGFAPTLAGDLTSSQDPVHKLLAIGDPVAIKSFRDRLNDDRLGVAVSLSKPHYGEITSSCTSKAAAVEVLRGEFGIDRASVIAFGDGENDIPMLRDAAIGIAMGNAPELVQQSAAQVTASNDDDGIARALIGLGLIS